MNDEIFSRLETDAYNQFHSFVSISSTRQQKIISNLEEGDVSAEAEEDVSKDEVVENAYEERIIDRALLDAIKRESKDTIQYLVKYANVNSLDYEDRENTALIKAIEYNKQDIVKLLLDVDGIDVSEENVNGRDALMTACLGGNKDIVSLLLTTQPIREIVVDGYGNTALMYALLSPFSRVDRIASSVDDEYSFKYRRDIMNLLLESADNLAYEMITTRNANERIPFMLAVIDNDEKMVEFMLRKSSRYINFQDKYGDTALIMACTWTTNVNIVKYLLKNNPNVFIRNKDGTTALLAACNTRYVKPRNDEVRLKHYSSYDVTTEPIKHSGKGLSGYRFRKKNFDFDVIKLLVNEGKANVNDVDNDGYTPLMKISLYVSCKEEDLGEVLDIMEFLLDSGANINYVDHENKTVLSVADSRKVIIFLLNNGVDINVGNSRDAFFSYHVYTDVELAKMFLDRGIDVNYIHTMFKNTLLHSSIKSYGLVYDREETKKVIELLLEQPNIDITIRDSDGNTAIDIAIEKMHTDIVSGLLEKYIEINFATIPQTIIIPYIKKLIEHDNLDVFIQALLGIVSFDIFDEKTRPSYLRKKLKDFEKDMKERFVAAEESKLTDWDELQRILKQIYLLQSYIEEQKYLTTEQYTKFRKWIDVAVASVKDIHGICLRNNQYTDPIDGDDLRTVYSKNIVKLLFIYPNPQNINTEEVFTRAEFLCYKKENMEVWSEAGRESVDGTVYYREPMTKILISLNELHEKILDEYEIMDDGSNVPFANTHYIINVYKGTDGRNYGFIEPASQVMNILTHALVKRKR